jgi:hypothetical protein
VQFFPATSPAATRFRSVTRLLRASGRGAAGTDVQETEDGVSRPDLMKLFNAAMVELYHQAKRQAGYNATYFLRMVSETGGLATAQRLLHSPTASEGFTALWEKGRLDLTVEALVLQERFVDLFTDEEREIARGRLAQRGYYARPKN